MREIVITINEAFNQENCCEYAKVLITGKNGKKRSRIVSMESLLKAMQKSLVIKRGGMAVGKIPFGYYDAQITEDQGMFCADMIAVLPAGKQMMRYEDTLYDVSIPSLVFRFEVNRERITGTRVYVMKDKTPTDQSCLYRYPFGNVSSQGGVCWGGNKLPDIHDLKGLEEAMMLFIQSPCNSDYYNGSDYCGHAGLSLRELFEKLKDEEAYEELHYRLNYDMEEVTLYDVKSALEKLCTTSSEITPDLVKRLVPLNEKEDVFRLIRLIDEKRTVELFHQADLMLENGEQNVIGTLSLLLRSYRILYKLSVCGCTLKEAGVHARTFVPKLTGRQADEGVSIIQDAVNGIKGGKYPLEFALRFCLSKLCQLKNE